MGGLEGGFLGKSAVAYYSIGRSEMTLFDVGNDVFLSKWVACDWFWLLVRDFML